MLPAMLLAKCLHYSSNLIYLGLGCFLVYLGVCLSTNQDYVNFSRLLVPTLQMPVLYYFMCAVTLFGVLVGGLSLLGIWATFSTSKILFSLHIFCLVVLLIGEATGIIFLGLSPAYIGLYVDREELTDRLQRSYAIPGKEHFTAAVDYIQTMRQCCGAEDSSDWSTSWWKLREYGPDSLIVPLTCCLSGEDFSHLDPVPANLTACQSKEEQLYSLFRYTKGCAEEVESWLQIGLRRAIYFSLCCIMYQLLLLLSAIYCAVNLLVKAS